MEANHIDTTGLLSPSELMAALEGAGVEPLRDPRLVTHQAARTALERLYQVAHLYDAEDELRIVSRLLATIVAINGPGEDKTH